MFEGSRIFNIRHLNLVGFEFYTGAVFIPRMLLCWFKSRSIIRPDIRVLNQCKYQWNQKNQTLGFPSSSPLPYSQFNVFATFDITIGAEIVRNLTSWYKVMCMEVLSIAKNCFYVFFYQPIRSLKFKKLIFFLKWKYIFYDFHICRISLGRKTLN
jgi:hypothetical protein